MIRVVTVFCKLNQISFSDRQWLEKDLAGFCPDARKACPFCGAKGCLEESACYDRYLIEVQEGTPVTHEVRIPRCRCAFCGHTHAALSGSLVPYRSYFLRFILRVLQCYFLHRKTVAVLCEAAGISPSTLYEWKKLFLREKSLWLGMLSDMEESAASFLEGGCSLIITGWGLIPSTIQNIKEKDAFLSHDHRQTPTKSAGRFRWIPTPTSSAMLRPPIGERWHR